MRPVIVAAAVAAALLCARATVAQEAAAHAEAPLRVFLDCPAWRCEPDFFRAEFPWVDFVVTPQDAEVQVLVTEVGTGSGGSDYTVTTLGRRQYDGRADTLHVFTPPDATADEVRHRLADRMALSFAPYVAARPGADMFCLRYLAGQGQRAARTQAARDPWDYWAFRVGLNTYLNGEQTYTSGAYHASVRASRITEGLKVQFQTYGQYDRDAFEVDSVTTLVNEQRSFGASLLLAPTIGTHWGWATRLAADRSTYENQKLALHAAAGLEFDLWPYAEVSRRLFTVRWMAGVDRFRYDDLTLYGRREETLTSTTAELSLDVTQPWGTLGASLEGSAYLHDLAQHRVELRGDMDIRLVRGLSLSLFGEVASVHDQRYLPAGDASAEEILIRRRQLATDYTYYVSVGLGYTFGSVFNNVVNPRFR
jgi:hypothetical protein